MIIVDTCKTLKNKVSKLIYAKKANINMFKLSGKDEQILLIKEKVFRAKESKDSFKPLDATKQANVKKIIISKNVNHLNEEEIFKLKNVDEIIVETTNASYKIINNSLYETNYMGTPKKLVRFLDKGNSEKVVLPEGVTEISEKAFDGSCVKTIMLYSKSESVAFYYTMAEKAKKLGLKSEIVKKEEYQDMLKNGNALFNKTKSISILDASISSTREENDTLLLGKRKFEIASNDKRILPSLTETQKEKIDVIRIAGNVDEISDELLQSFYNVKEFNVEPSNKKYKTIDGCLYTKDNVLVRYATGRKEEEIFLPEEIAGVKNFAFTQKDSSIKKCNLLYKENDSKSSIFEIVPKLNSMNLPTKILNKEQYMTALNELKKK